MNHEEHEEHEVKKQNMWERTPARDRLAFPGCIATRGFSYERWSFIRLKTFVFLVFFVV
jgi:hypothetical protein